MIGIFDSGEGGLSVLKEITRLLPDGKYIYYSDNANCPYGEKTPEFILERCRAITDELVGKGADIIVVACNTATAAAIAQLRKEYSDSARITALSGGRRDRISFIGMEPAVKPAALGTRTGVIGVLATAGTLKGSKYLNTKGSYKDNCKIVESVGKGFVELVEAGMTEGEEAERVVRESLQPLLDEGADTIVLGCTHYPFLLATMKKIAGPDIRFIDPAPAVARHLIYVLVQDRLLDEHSATQVLARLVSADVPGGKTTGLPKKPDVTLISSGDPEPLSRVFDSIYG